MENKQITMHRSLQKPKQQLRKDKFRGKAPRKSTLYDKQRCKSFRRNGNYSSSSSDLEAETAFKFEYGVRNRAKSEALRRIFENRKSSNFTGATVKAIGKECIGKNSSDRKLAFSITPIETYTGFCSSRLNSYEKDSSGNCSSAASTDSSCKERCNVLIDDEGIGTNPNNSYHESYSKPRILMVDSLHACKERIQETHRNLPLCAWKNSESHRNVPIHAVKNQKNHRNLTKRGRGITEEAPSLRDCKEQYPSLSQKYSPKSFNELVGQNIVVKSLLNAIMKEKIAPVYLFHGPSGTGKTSTARIFASALNCLSANFKSKPCWKCRECFLFRTGKSPNITEANAGSNICIEKIRRLLESVQFSQSVSGYKIFIVNDCHMLTPEVWSNFLLKSFKSPVDYVVFILITTDLEMIPRTTLSRCQKFPFQKLKDVDMFNRLHKLAVAENIDIEEDALHLITAKADGSLLHAEAILDQLSLLATKITLSEVRQMVGLIPHEKLVDLLEFALSSDTTNTVKSTRDIIDSGVEPLSLVSQLATLITDILAGSCILQRVQETQRFFDRHWLSKDKTEKLGQSLKTLAEAEKQIRASNDCTSWLTAALLQLASDGLSKSIHQSHADFLDACEVGTGEVESSIAEEECYGKDQCGVHGVPCQIVSPKNPDIITIKDSGIIASSDLISGFSESSKDQFHDPNMVNPSHSQNTGDISEDASTVIESVSLPTASLNYSRVNEAEQMGLNPVSPCKMEQIWQNALRSNWSTALKGLLKGRGKLVSLMACKANAIAYLEFGHPQHKVKAERLEVSISNALEEVLGCPVEVKMALAPSGSVQERSETTDAFANKHKDILYCQEKKLSTYITAIKKLRPVRCILLLFGRNKIVGSLRKTSESLMQQKSHTDRCQKCFNPDETLNEKRENCANLLNQDIPGFSRGNGKSQGAPIKDQRYEGQFENRQVNETCSELTCYGNGKNWSIGHAERLQMHSTPSTSRNTFCLPCRWQGDGSTNIYSQNLQFNRVNPSRNLDDVTDMRVGTSFPKEKEHSKQNIKSKHHTMCGSLFCCNKMQVKHLKWRRALQFGLKFVPCTESSDCVFKRGGNSIQEFTIWPRCFTIKCFFS